MLEQSGTLGRRILVLCVAGSLLVVLPAVPCPGSERTAEPTITLNVQSEPLRTVLGRISRTTRWKISAPEKWLDKPVTQTLNNVPMEQGLRFILRDAGVENLLVTYDENRKTVTVYDTEIQPDRSVNRQPENRQPEQGTVRPSVPFAVNPSDPMLSRPAREERPPGPSRGNSRTRSKRQAHMDEE